MKITGCKSFSMNKSMTAGARRRGSGDVMAGFLRARQKTPRQSETCLTAWKRPRFENSSHTERPRTIDTLAICKDFLAIGQCILGL